jgi:DNA-binding XRE family transcriptional regulator
MRPSSEVTDGWRALGRRVARIRKACGYTQDTLGEALDYTRSSIANIETGKQQPPRELWVTFDKMFSAEGTLVAEYDRLKVLQRADQEARAEHAAAILSGAIQQEELPEDVAVIEERRRRMTESNLDEIRLGYIESALHWLVTSDQRPENDEPVLTQTRQLRSYVDILLTGHQYPAQRIRLYRVAVYASAYLALLAGDVDKHRAAEAYAAEAHAMAEVLDRPVLTATTRVVQGAVACGIAGVHETLVYIRDGLRVASLDQHDFGDLFLGADVDSLRSDSV